MTHPLRQITVGGRDTSCLGVGAMSFSDVWGTTTDANSLAVLDAAAEAGVTHIDTANIYGMGRSETVIGQWLAANQDLRDDMLIATKGGITADADGKRKFDNSPEHLEAELDGSLKRLGLDYVDLYYVHRREAAREIEEVTETLARLIEKGKIRSFGFSEIAPTSLCRASTIHPVAAVQSEYSLSARFSELGLVQACEKLGTTMVAFSPVGRSWLTARPIPYDLAKDMFFANVNPRFQRDNHARNMRATLAFRDLAAQAGENPASLAIAWLLSQGDHVLPIPGTRSTEHFAHLVRGAKMKLGADLKAAIEEVLPVGWCHGDRYDVAQRIGPENFC